MSDDPPPPDAGPPGADGLPPVYELSSSGTMSVVSPPVPLGLGVSDAASAGPASDAAAGAPLGCSLSHADHARMLEMIGPPQAASPYAFQSLEVLGEVLGPLAAGAAADGAGRPGGSAWMRLRTDGTEFAL